MRKALSGVARAQGRAGLTAIAKMLHGEADAQITRMRLDRLSTHGLFAEHTLAWVRALLRRLISGGPRGHHHGPLPDAVPHQGGGRRHEGR